MDIQTAFASTTLKAADVEDEDLSLTITGVEVEEVGQGKDKESKPCIYFKETDKKLVLNKTNAGVIAKLYGNDTDGWVGKRIALYSTEVEFRGEVTLGLRVRLKSPAGNGNSTAQAQAPAQRSNRTATATATAPPTNSKSNVSPRAKAWSAFCDATPNTEMDPRKDAWAEAVAEVFPGRDEKTLGGADWIAFAQKIESEYTEGDGFLPI